MLSVVVWKWHNPTYRSKFPASAVNVMRNMVARHYPDPHRFICITDDPEGIDDNIEIVPLWEDWGDIPNPTWGWGPSCYRRLRAFAPDFEEIAGRRFVSIDLDCVITGDLRPLWNRHEDFVIYASVQARMAYNGSMFMMTAGARRQVWEQFDPETSPVAANAAGFRGSDQGWIGYCLGQKEVTWCAQDGIFAYRHDCLKLHGGGLPAGSRLIVFHGKFDPWHEETQRLSPWIKTYYH